MLGTAVQANPTLNAATLPQATTPRLAYHPGPQFGRRSPQPLAPGCARLQIERQTTGMNDDRERRGRVLLLGKGAVLAHRLARPLAAESDDKQQLSGTGSPGRAPLRLQRGVQRSALEQATSPHGH